MTVGSTLLDRELEELLEDSAELIARTRLLLVDARSCFDTADEAPQAPAAPAHRTRRMPVRFALTAPAAAGLVLLGIAVGELGHSPAGQTALSVRTSSRPDAAAPVTAPAQRGAAVQPPPTPQWVSIPRLSVKAAVAGEVQVISAGPEKGLLSAPPNYHDLGWFRQSAGGLLVLDGHVGYRSAPGPLAFIGSLKEGDQVIVGNQSGQQSFRILVVGHVVKGKLPSQYFTGAYGGDLMLITCDYLSPFSDGHFADNVYAVAQPG